MTPQKTIPVSLAEYFNKLGDTGRVRAERFKQITEAVPMSYLGLRAQVMGGHRRISMRMAKRIHEASKAIRFNDYIIDIQDLIEIASREDISDKRLTHLKAKNDNT